MLNAARKPSALKGSPASPDGATFLLRELRLRVHCVDISESTGKSRTHARMHAQTHARMPARTARTGAREAQELTRSEKLDELTRQEGGLRVTLVPEQGWFLQILKGPRVYAHFVLEHLGGSTGAGCPYHAP